MNKQILLQCENVCKSYHEGDIKTDILHDISFTIYSNDMIAVVGSSGSGKSTLLHLLGSLDTPTTGDIRFKGRLLKRMSSAEKSKLRNQDLGFIYQFHHLLPDFSALENVAMPLLIANYSITRAKARALEVVTLLGLSDRAGYRPSQLSGGERQRVAIARALVNNPCLVLADEPTGNLDEQNTNSILKLILQINKKYGTTFVVVTHDLYLANQLQKKIEIKDGRLIDQNMFVGYDL
ncbi:lipoprotein-releasing ABC transporter ATP-binding protein LolD [Candidatus Erwinia haradaeae]|uniref:Lipoprotein-releasing system ATP-binding protein LolD n=1 Tax=Candidatus Erwinia haradaeae TaxID=1922217 RepID=A0A451D348_9GAMM|nr:lipoprotein-releasing ABC transporter ATP-binding protein LolD [Candidatus Erwinia haradaeae]VFP80108.1 Lipoprotein-releasing system ATP-binding proteinLolD [Candidatus Erwinia haradaeae]